VLAMEPVVEVEVVEAIVIECVCGVGESVKVRVK
jgi:hypothetical protein